MGRTDKFNLQKDEELAEEVRKYPCLNDKVQEHYRDKRKVANAYKRVGWLGFEEGNILFNE